MGHTRVIYTDATTAEAASVLKGIGFAEGSQGGLFTSQSTAVKIYVVWGKSSYYPEIFQRLDFVPRIQVHLKCREDGADLGEFTKKAVSEFGALAPGTRIRVFDADSGEEVP